MEDAKATAEISNQAIARAWYADVDLTFNGVDMADCMVYDVLNVLGRAWLNDANQRAQQEAKANDKPST